MIPAIGMKMQIVWTTLRNGLISCWEFDETSGTSVLDSVGSNHGTVTGAAINQTGKLNKAYSFDGSGDYITFPNANFKFNPLTQSYTISMWVKSADPTPTTSTVYLINTYDGGSTAYPFVWNIIPSQTNNIWMVLSNGSETKYPTISGSLVWNNAWHLLTMVVKHTEKKIYAYLDGQEKQNVAYTFSSFTTPTTYSIFSISKLLTANDRYYSGMIDQVAIWTKELSTTEISALYNSGNGLPYTSW